MHSARMESAGEEQEIASSDGSWAKVRSKSSKDDVLLSNIDLLTMAVKGLSSKVEMLEAKMETKHHELGEKLNTLEAKVKTHHEELLEKLTTSSFTQMECSQKGEVTSKSFQMDKMHQDLMEKLSTLEAETAKMEEAKERIAKLESFVEQMKQVTVRSPPKKTHVSFTVDGSQYDCVPLSMTAGKLMEIVLKERRPLHIAKNWLLDMNGLALNLFPDTPIADLGVTEGTQMRLQKEFSVIH